MTITNTLAYYGTELHDHKMFYSTDCWF